MRIMYIMLNGSMESRAAGLEGALVIDVTIVRRPLSRRIRPPLLPAVIPFKGPSGCGAQPRAASQGFEHRKSLAGAGYNNRDRIHATDLV